MQQWSATDGRCCRDAYQYTNQRNAVLYLERVVRFDYDDTLCP